MYSLARLPGSDTRTLSSQERHAHVFPYPGGIPVQDVVELLGGVERIQPARISDYVVQNGKPGHMDVPLGSVHAVRRILASGGGAQRGLQPFYLALQLGYGLFLGFGHSRGEA